MLTSFAEQVAHVALKLHAVDSPLSIMKDDMKALAESFASFRYSLPCPVGVASTDFAVACIFKELDKHAELEHITAAYIKHLTDQQSGNHDGANAVHS